VIWGSNLDIQGVTIAHGVNLSGFGGCVFTYGDLSLTDVHISACIASNGAAASVGGGAAVLGNLTMHRSTISSSKTSGHDSAAGGGAAVGGTTTLYDSTISGNKAETSQGPAYGGGLYGNGVMTLHASTIDGNIAYSPSSVAYGGGMHASHADVFVLDGSAVTNNSAGSSDSWSYGGGINSGIIASPASAMVTVSHSTISGNTVDSHCGSCFVTGGGVQAMDAIAVEYSTIDHNKAVCADASSACTAGGGGLSSAGVQATSSVSLLNATISTNQAIGATMAPAIGIAGGVLASASAAIVAHNATIAFNHASTSGAGVAGRSPSELISTIVANNDSDTGPSDIGIGLFANTLTIGGSNDLVVAADPNVTLPNNTQSADPHLQPLTTDEGGTTAIHPLASDSAAIDGGANPVSLGCDQRGLPYRRTYGANTDIGAYEYQGEPHLFSDGFDGPNPPCVPAP
jgi:hypothetical protein